VLFADDREAIRSLFHRLLRADGHDVLAPDGASALAAVHRHRPDVILLDVAMPLIDGLEVCRQLKSDPATRLTPVVLVSGQTELTDRINGIEAGADDYLSKPVHPTRAAGRLNPLYVQAFLETLFPSAFAETTADRRWPTSVTIVVCRIPNPSLRQCARS
jgi:two-component system response regulator MprA